MANLKIGTWNIKNSYFNLRKNEMKAAAVVQLLQEENLDFLALQEVNTILAEKIDKKISDEYKVITSYDKSQIKNLRVEYNMIVSKNYPYTLSSPIELPYKPTGLEFIKNITSIRKRNINYQYILTPIDQPDILMGVTHLDYAVQEIGKRQMEKVIDITRSELSDNYSIVLAGNINKKPSEPNMIEFTEQLSQLGMKVVDNPHKTYIGHNDEQPVDYIIVPDDWEVEYVKTLENYEDISSHRPVIVKVKTEKSI